MKTFIGAAIIATAVAFFAIAPLGGAGTTKDSAVGGFRGVGGVNNVAFSAHSDADGANPYGNLNQTIPPQGRKDRFTVTCLAVAGNEAAIGLTADNATTAANFPDGRVLIVIDNGNPVKGKPVDTYGYLNGTTDCAAYVHLAVVNHPETGNISVNDAA